MLLSRFQGTIDDWDPVVLGWLTARRRVIAFDNAGIGLSKGTGQSSITEMADTILGFVDALGLPVPCRPRSRGLAALKSRGGRIRAAGGC
jgi:pimeloyl-ACP methyl ester carboxylesterase